MAVKLESVMGKLNLHARDFLRKLVGESFATSFTPSCLWKNHLIWREK